MSVTISIHAAKRAEERGISEEGIRAIVSGGVDTIFMPSDTEPEVTIVYGAYGNKIWAVMVNDNTNNVITVRRARKKEVTVYEEEYGKHRGIL